MQYKYNPDCGAFYQGLPAADLDDKDLSPEQKELLALGVKAGMYKAVSTPAPSKKKATDEPETPA